MHAPRNLAAHLLALEEELLARATRQDGARLDALLANDFVEHGVSGTVWTKPAVIAALQGESHSARRISEFTVRLLAADVALATYRIERVATPARPGAQSLRASIWRNENGRWRLAFHQGTPLHP